MPVLAGSTRCRDVEPRRARSIRRVFWLAAGLVVLGGLAPPIVGATSPTSVSPKPISASKPTTKR